MNDTVETTSTGNQETPATEIVDNSKIDATPPANPSVIEPPIEEKEDPEFSKRFAALSRKEREILAQAEKIKGDLDQVNEWRKTKDLIKTNPLKFMEENGWKFNDLVDFTLNDQKMTPQQQIEKLQSQIEELRNEKLQEKEAAQKSEVESSINKYKKEQRDYLSSKADTYELLNKYESFDTVYEIMNQHFISTNGEILDVDKVAAEVEKQLEGYIEKATSTKKFQTRFASAPSVTEPVKSVERDEKKSPATLTNKELSSSSTSSHSEGWLDDDASKRRAAKLLEDMWKRDKK